MKALILVLHRPLFIVVLMATLAACGGSGNSANVPSNELRALQPQALAQDSVTNEPTSLEIVDLESAVLSLEQ